MANRLGWKAKPFAREDLDSNWRVCASVWIGQQGKEVDQGGGGTFVSMVG